MISAVEEAEDGLNRLFENIDPSVAAEAGVTGPASPAGETALRFPSDLADSAEVGRELVAETGGEIFRCLQLRK